MTRPGLTKAQARVLGALRRLTKGDVAPSQKELSAHLGIGQPRVREHLMALERKGRIQRRTAEWRSAVIVDPAAVSDEGSILDALATAIVAQGGDKSTAQYLRDVADRIEKDTA